MALRHLATTLKSYATDAHGFYLRQILHWCSGPWMMTATWDNYHHDPLAKHSKGLRARRLVI